MKRVKKTNKEPEYTRYINVEVLCTDPDQFWKNQREARLERVKRMLENGDTEYLLDILIHLLYDVTDKSNDTEWYRKNE